MLRRGFCALWMFSAALAADTLHLATGGKVTGTLTEIKFEAGKDTLVLDAEKIKDIQAIELGTSDRITFNDGQARTGQIVQLKVKTLGGELPFSRDKFIRLDRELSEQQRLLNEYKARKDKLGLDDAAGWCGLATWASQNRLKREQREAAQQSLDIDPNHKMAAQAHQLLGHVLKDKVWMTTEEAKAADGEKARQEEEEMRAKGLVKVGNRWVEKEKVERIEELKERIQDIEKNICREIEDTANSKMGDVTVLIDDAKNKLGDAEREAEFAKAERAEHAGHGGCTGFAEADARYKRSKKIIQDAEEELKTARGKANTASQVLKRSAQKRKGTVHDEAVRLIRKIEAGEEVDETTIEEKLRPADLSTF